MLQPAVPTVVKSDHLLATSARSKNSVTKVCGRPLTVTTTAWIRRHSWIPQPPTMLGPRATTAPLAGVSSRAFQRGSVPAGRLEARRNRRFAARRARPTHSTALSRQAVWSTAKP